MAEFPGYYIVNGRKVKPDGTPYKGGKEDPEELTPEQEEIAQLKAELEALKAEKPAEPEAPKAPAAPKVPGKA